ncbi:MAG: translation initiation factor IF-2 [Deltaproteobacteria bacterium]|nr:translation initiation factor IF-2 [Deltaproteobacteria bacterium]
MSSGRLHEIAKALGVSAKILMVDLAKEGFTYKTHMALVDEKAMKVIQKKYPQVDEKMAALASAPVETKPKKPKVAKASRVVTKRTTSSKKSASLKKDSVVEPDEVSIVQREEGVQGTVTLEQRVVKEGVLRRRRVEPSATPAAPAIEASVPAEENFSSEETAAPVEVSSKIAAAPASPRNLSDTQPILRRAPLPPPSAPVAPRPPVEKPKAPTAPSTATPAAVVEAVPASPSRSTFSVPSTGRNLSAPSRLKIVDTPAIPPRPPAPLRRPGTPAVAGAAKPAIGTAPTEEGSAEDRLKKHEAAKKKAATASKLGEPSRVTKKDLLGMMEEVEITRPLGRRPKKATQRMERRQTQITTPGATKRVIRIEDEITVADLADRMAIKASDIIRKLLTMGQMATIQQKLDHDTAILIASEYNYEVQNVAESAETVLQSDAKEDEGPQEHRPAIVTVMGHVDHGKTSLLDHIRKSRVVAGEAGGITQHIGAYQVTHNNKKITFIDTPGHAAFTAMRARGASLTDIVILVVAADEGVKPQTLEALAHAKAAEVPVIVAINKIDKPEAKPDVPLQELSGHGLVPESWGGDTIYSKVSAHTGEGITELLEMILLQSEVLDLKANPESSAKGIVIESRLDKGKGPVATVIVQNGTLKVGNSIVSGTSFGKVRAMFDALGKSITEAGPSTPVEILGFESVPSAGDNVSAVSDDAVARRASELSVLAKKKMDSMKNSRMSLEDMYKKMQAGDVSELRVILKGDVQGSLEAIADSLEKIKHDKVRVQVLFKAVGGISESDVDLAAASGALIFGFNVRPTAQAKALAARENVQIKTYEIIYELLDEVKLAMQGLLAPIIKEHVVGQAEVREVFTVSKVGPIAGCFVKSGKIIRNAQARLIRDSVVIYTAKVSSLRRFKDDAKEVLENFECGIRLENYSDLKPGDIIECFETTEMKQAV